MRELSRLVREAREEEVFAYVEWTGSKRARGMKQATIDRIRVCFEYLNPRIWYKVREIQRAQVVGIKKCLAHAFPETTPTNRARAPSGTS